ncbi:N-acetylmuramoyl-L-alanine amidase family protein [Rubritalea sp.]|uniref:N-acetylmuramoyl-L-alanine amidase family protein n=1 Tax=Rubritalea sp. TaxID=2109375 RepID=UPI003EF9C094
MLTLRHLFTALLLIASCGVATAGAFSTVVIDAGHGGKDIGGNYDKVYEKHLALDTAKRVEYLLKRKGYRTKMTRTSDVFISLQKRASIGNRYGNSIFVSIHYNYTYRKAANGIETFYYTSRSKSLAKYVQEAMLSKTRAYDRGVKFARYYVIRNAKNPAILVEGGFLQNSSERRAVKKGSYRQRIAEGIVSGIEKYQYARKKGWSK